MQHLHAARVAPLAGYCILITESNILSAADADGEQKITVCAVFAVFTG